MSLRLVTPRLPRQVTRVLPGPTLEPATRGAGHYDTSRLAANYQELASAEDHSFLLPPSFILVSSRISGPVWSVDGVVYDHGHWSGAAGHEGILPSDHVPWVRCLGALSSWVLPQQLSRGTICIDG